MTTLYNQSENIVSNKVFIVQRSEIGERWDPMYYRPEIANLEKKVRAIAAKKLRDYIIRISSGATPSVKEEEKFYSDKENGIPFLRVQNLQTNGKLSLDDVKYINKRTHDDYLRRSQVSEGDLLVKITGVGRMAIASVAPDDFVGNTNQHMVIIKTKNKETSEYLANYLNLDIVEKLASRRATGGTRPALDYPALKSIPIVEGIDFTLIREAERLKQQKENEAKALLATIDDYLLDELGIIIPITHDNLKNRIFISSFNNISGIRFDPNFHLKMQYLLNQKCKYEFSSLKEFILGVPQYGANEEAINGNQDKDIRYIRITDIDDLGNLKNDSWKTTINVDEKYLLNKDDILFARSGSVGRCYIHKDITHRSIFAGYLIRFVLNAEIINPNFLFFYCHSSIYKYWVDAISRPAVQSNINSEEYKSLPIPLLPMEKQNEIAEKISKIRLQVKALQQEANDILEQAKKQVEEKILRETI